MKILKVPLLAIGLLPALHLNAATEVTELEERKQLREHSVERAKQRKRLSYESDEKRRKWRAERLAVSSFALDYDAVAEYSDVIVVAKLFRAPDPGVNRGDGNKTRSWRRKFYKFIVVEPIKGKASDEIPIFCEDILFSHKGPCPEIEYDVPYLLFLKLQKGEGESDTYSIIGNWKGIVSMQKDVKEERAAKIIYQSKSIDIKSNLNTFKEAISFTANETNIADLSTDAQAFVRDLGLKKLLR